MLDFVPGLNVVTTCSSGGASVCHTGNAVSVRSILKEFSYCNPKRVILQ